MLLLWLLLLDINKTLHQAMQRGMLVTAFCHGDDRVARLNMYRVLIRVTVVIVV